ncbi:hypothetical protein ACO3TA_05855 [Methanocaldococcus sp. 28A]
MNNIRLLGIKSFNEFINEVLRINPRIYRVEDYARGLIEAMSNNTYLETISKLNYPSADSYYLIYK